MSDKEYVELQHEGINFTILKFSDSVAQELKSKYDGVDIEFTAQDLADLERFLKKYYKGESNENI